MFSVHREERERERRLENRECKTVAVCFNVQCTESGDREREREKEREKAAQYRI